MQYTEEQIIRANQTDLVSFLNAQGEQLMKSGKEYRWKKHDSAFRRKNGGAETRKEDFPLEKTG